MTSRLESIATKIETRCQGKLVRQPSTCGELTYEVAPADLFAICKELRDDAEIKLEQLIDITGVDYLNYGRDEWSTHESTSKGFSRGVNLPSQEIAIEKRFAVVYHLMSVTHNFRVRLRAFCVAGDPPMIDSVCDLWASANWFEREVFDLFGVWFQGHPDLRRILTDYGFIGHPFRKDFPLIGNVEVRYDPEKKRVVYQPVSIEPRTLVPRVIRHDPRYEEAFKEASKNA